MTSPPATTRLEPLRFRRRFIEKPWGGRALAARFGFQLPPGRIGETWELVDRESENSLVATGGLEGMSLRELVQRHGKDLLGKVPAGRGGRFPLLVKYIDAADDLSVQLHPDVAGAARIPGAEEKTEAWYVLDAKPGAMLYAGLRPEVTARDFERVAAGPGVLETLHAWPARPGECLLVPGGTVHAIGAGVTILEIQQNSDTTFRLWDWGRPGRETHVEQALACARFGDPVRAPIVPRWFRDGDVGVAHLARSQHFGMNLLRVTRPVRRTTFAQYNVYTVVEGRGTLRWNERRMQLVPGDVWLVPASCGYHHVEPETDELVLMHVIHRP